MDDARRWAAVVRRDASFDGAFVYCVKSTKVFCRPICKARLARRMNVEFCDTATEAESKGYRPCKRCQPLLPSYNPEAAKIKKACNFLQGLGEREPLPGLERLAQEAGLTKHHFHRLFKREVGMTPREYALACRSGKGCNASASSGLTPVTDLSEVPPQTDCYEEDTNVDWSFLDAAPDSYGFHLIGYTLEDSPPNTTAATINPLSDLALEQVEVLVIYFSIVETAYGRLLIAFKGEQVCKLELGSSEQELMDSLKQTFPEAFYLHSHVSLASSAEATHYQHRINAVVDALEVPTGKLVDVPVGFGTDADCSVLR